MWSKMKMMRYEHACNPAHLYQILHCSFFNVSVGAIEAYATTCYVLYDATAAYICHTACHVYVDELGMKHFRKQDLQGTVRVNKLVLLWDAQMAFVFVVEEEKTRKDNLLPLEKLSFSTFIKGCRINGNRSFSKDRLYRVCRNKRSFPGSLYTYNSAR